MVERLKRTGTFRQKKIVKENRLMWNAREIHLVPFARRCGSEVKHVRTSIQSRSAQSLKREVEVEQDSRRAILRAPSSRKLIQTAPVVEQKADQRETWRPVLKTLSSRTLIRTALVERFENPVEQKVDLNGPGRAVLRPMSSRKLS